MADIDEGQKTYTQEELQAAIAEANKGAAEKARELLTEAKRAKDALKAYDGVDPSEYAKLKQAAADAETARAKKEGDFESLKAQMVENHTKELGIREQKVSKYEKALHKRLVEAELRKSIADVAASPDMIELLVERGQRFVRVRENDDDFEAYVVNESGAPRISDGKATPMTIVEFVEQDLRVRHPGAFKGTGSSGSGAPAKTVTNPAGGSGQRVIPVGDKKAYIDNIADIAAGKAIVR